MYNVKGPSKIVAKTTRRGISQNMENIRDHNRNRSFETDTANSTPVPKPVFHKKSTPSHHRQEVISPQHEEIIKFINDSWNSVYSEVCRESESNQISKGEHSLYYEDDASIYPEGFKPFDLESWWGRRLYACITGSVNNKN